jgi:dTDP-4-dehydrorhamnose reductase
LPPLPSHIRYLSLDITIEDEVNTVIKEYSPDVIIHTAAMTNVDQCEEDKEGCWQLNVKAVEYLVYTAEQCSAHFIHLSTDFIFSGEEGPLDENAIPAPVNYYGESKLAAELIVQECKTSWAIVRTVLVYGVTPGMSRSNIILWVKSSLEKGETINVVNDQWRTPTLAEDLAAGCVLIAQQKAQGVFNISGKDFLTPYEMAIQTAEYFDLDNKLIKETDGSKFQQKAKRPAKTGFIIDKAVNELGYQPKSFLEGIEMLAGQIK